MKSAALLLFGFVLCAASAFSQTESDIRLGSFPVGLHRQRQFKVKAAAAASR
jgi:hypothetical protein